MKYIKRCAVPLLFLLLGVHVLERSITSPAYNWDMIGYIAAAKSFELNNIDSLHTFTYKQVQSVVTPEKYKSLTHDESNNYRYIISTDVSAFVEQLPFYKIRPFYTGLIYIFYKLGINIVFSTHFISGLAVAIAIIFLYLLSTSVLKKQFIFTIPFFAIVFSVADLGSYSTPDGLSFLATIIVSYLFSKERFTTVLFLLPLILSIRTDLIIFTIPLLIVMFYLQKSIRWKIAMSIIFSLLFYICLITYWDHPGWTSIYYFSLIKQTTHPISEPQSVTLFQYLRILYYSIKSLLNYNIFMLYMLISVSSIFLFINQLRNKSSIGVHRTNLYILSSICIIYVVVHFLILPLPWARFFTAPYLIGTIMLLAILPDYLVKDN